MAFLFAKFTELTERVSEGMKVLNDVAASLSLDNLQSEFGDPSGRRARYEGLDFSYITPRLIAMGFPSTPSTKIRSRNDAETVRSLLNERHAGHYMIFNMSEQTQGNGLAYDYSLFDDQVREVTYPGMCALPLAQAFKLCESVHAWLRADERNVAVIHCMTGGGRTALACACVLAFQFEFSSALSALEYVCSRRGTSITPTLTRYCTYVDMLANGHQPEPQPRTLTHVIIHGIPACEPEPVPVEGDAAAAAEAPLQHARTFRPTLQLFADGAMLYSSASVSETGESVGLVWYSQSESAARFTVGVKVLGDVCMRVTHTDTAGQTHTLVRTQWHTGYTSATLRMTRAHMDTYSHTHVRFPDDFFVEFFFDDEAPAADAPPVAPAAVWADAYNHMRENKAAVGTQPEPHDVPRSGTGPSLEEIIRGAAASSSTAAAAASIAEPAPTAAPTTHAPQSVSAELEAELATLASLERDLGLDMTTTSTTATSVSSAAVASSPPASAPAAASAPSAAAVVPTAVTPTAVATKAVSPPQAAPAVATVAKPNEASAPAKPSGGDDIDELEAYLTSLE